jgi:hypothetical protein
MSNLPKSARAKRLAHLYADRWQIEEKVSFYQLSREVAAISRGMEVAVDARQWAIFADMTARRFARWLIDLTEKMDLRRYRKHPRGRKNPYLPRTHGRRIKHVATARILRDRLASSG